MIPKPSAFGIVKRNARVYTVIVQHASVYVAGSGVVKLTQYPRMAVESREGLVDVRYAKHFLIHPEGNESVRESRRIHGFESQGIFQSVCGHGVVP